MSLRFHLVFWANPFGTKYLRVNYCQKIIWAAGFCLSNWGSQVPKDNALLFALVFFSVSHSSLAAFLFVKISKFRAALYYWKQVHDLCTLQYLSCPRWIRSWLSAEYSLLVWGDEDVKGHWSRYRSVRDPSHGDAAKDCTLEFPEML